MPLEILMADTASEKGQGTKLYNLITENFQVNICIKRVVLSKRELWMLHEIFLYLYLFPMVQKVSLKCPLGWQKRVNALPFKQIESVIIQVIITVIYFILIHHYAYSL